MFDLSFALESTYPECSYMDFYRDLFPEGTFEKKGVYEDGKYNGIAVSIKPGEKRAKRMTVTDDLEAIDCMAQTDDFCLMSPISYAGKSRKSENARFMYALAIDLDGIDSLQQWEFFRQQITRGHEMLSFVWGLPVPTYLVSSGSGVHIYYVFEKPIPMFRNIVEQLEVLKKRLTWQAWTQGASSLHDKVQYESLFQGFRVVGTITKNGGRCRAFSVGEKVTVEYLNRFVPSEYQVKSLVYKSDLRLEDAKKKYPEWYQSRIVENRPKGTWTCKRDLYDWWIRKLTAGAEQGHRYWCIMTLATYAMKCGIPREELEEDAYGLIPLMNEKGDAFTEDDVLHALEAYTDSYITYPIDTIVVRTGIPITKNKRNYRKQEQHLGRARAVQAFDDPDGNWRNKNGSPKKSRIVEKWRLQHPDGTKAECNRDTGLDPKTIRKWWNMDDKKLYSYTDRQTMAMLSREERQMVAQMIVKRTQEIAKEENITEEQAYELFRKRNKEPDPLQEQADKLIFAESEMTPEFMMALAEKGIRNVQVVPDEEYETAMFEKYLQSLK